jgi:hypothetical protein
MVFAVYFLLFCISTAMVDKTREDKENAMLSLNVPVNVSCDLNCSAMEQSLPIFPSPFPQCPGGWNNQTLVSVLLWEAASSGFVEERSLILSGTISDLGLQATEARGPELSSLRTFLSSLAELRSAHRNPMAQTMTPISKSFQLAHFQASAYPTVVAKFATSLLLAESGP